MSRDYDERRRETIEFHNRQQDRQDEFRAQSDRTSAVFDGIREKDDLKVAWALDLPLTSSHSSLGSQHTQRPPTAGQQFSQHSNKLLFHLEWSEALPERLRQEWAAKIKQLDIEEPAASLVILTRVLEDYDDIQRLKPPLWDLSHAMSWEVQVPRIGHELRWLEDLLNHVIRLAKEYGP